MLDLYETQQQLQNFILQKKSSIAKGIITSNNLSAINRLEIYQDSYQTRLLDALKKDYPVLLALMGIESFNSLGLKYINTHPSTHRSIRWFGETLNEFLQHYLDINLLWQAEMAKFEWALMMAFDSANSSILTLEEMSLIPFEKWPDIYFELHPSMQLLSLYWNIVPIWNAYKEENCLLKPLRAKVNTNWIIWRKNLAIHFYSLSSDEAYMLDAMMKKNNFSSICEGLCHWVDEELVANHAAILLKRFIVDKMISKIIF